MEGMDAPMIPVPKPKDEFFIKFLRQELAEPSGKEKSLLAAGIAA